jgi:prevent-host-death family protein
MYETYTLTRELLMPVLPRRPAISSVDARDRLSDVINRAAYGGERVVLTRRGRALAAIVPMQDVERLEAIEAKLDAADFRKAKKAAARGHTTPWSDLKRELRLK